MDRWMQDNVQCQILCAIIKELKKRKQECGHIVHINYKTHLKTAHITLYMNSEHIWLLRGAKKLHNINTCGSWEHTDKAQIKQAHR